MPRTNFQPPSLKILVQEYQLLGVMARLAFDASGLGAEWENVDTIRSRVREGESLVVLVGKTCSAEGTIAECVANMDILLPSLARLFISNLKLPTIQSLRDEVEIVYQKCQRQPSEDKIDDGAWEIRKLLKFVKRKATRSDPSLDTRSAFIKKRFFLYTNL